jgi:hypothetical protein
VERGTRRREGEIIANEAARVSSERGRGRNG